MQKRYVKIKCKPEKSALEGLWNSKEISHRVNQRIHAILLSNKGYDVNSLCEIFNISLPTIYSWFDNYESKGVAGLYDEARSGRPSRLTPSEQKKP